MGAECDEELVFNGDPEAPAREGEEFRRWMKVRAAGQCECVLLYH